MQREVYIIGMQAISGDKLVGTPYFDRADAEAEIERLETEENYTSVWFDIRHIEDKDAQREMVEMVRD